VAAAVILPTKFNHPWLNDSKQLTEKQRDTLRPIIEQEALAWAVASVLPKEIDEINILNASFLAMHRALAQIKLNIDLILVDGNRFKPYAQTDHKCIIKGDGIYRSIAAASVLAKTHRDEVMMRLHQEYPHYAWDKNKGYPTKLHRDAIRIKGACEQHRMSFTLLPEQLEIDFSKHP
jgi:ribonuclease HII